MQLRVDVPEDACHGLLAECKGKEDAKQLLLACIVLLAIRLAAQYAGAAQCLLQCSPAIVFDALGKEAPVAGVLVQGIRQQVQRGFDDVEEVDAVGRGEGGGCVEAGERAQGGEQDVKAAHMAEGVFGVCVVGRVDQQLAHAAEGVALALQRVWRRARRVGGAGEVVGQGAQLCNLVVHGRGPRGGRRGAVRACGRHVQSRPPLRELVGVEWRGEEKSTMSLRASAVHGRGAAAGAGVQSGWMRGCVDAPGLLSLSPSLCHDSRLTTPLAH